MDHAFQIPTERKDSIFRRFKICTVYKDSGEMYTIAAYEYYQAYKLPIIKGNPFVKVNSN